MKTNLFRIFRLLPVVMMAFVLGSCEEVEFEIDVPDSSAHVAYSTEYLISRIWVDEWKDENDVYYRQELTFGPNHLGEDYMYTEDRWGRIKESTYTFTWDWRNSRCSSIRLKYGPGDYSYMNDILMGGNKLDCMFDGQRALFTGH